MAKNPRQEPATAADDLRLALRQCRVALPTIALFAAFTNLLLLAPSIYIMQVYDRAVPAGHTETLWALAGVTIGALAFMAFFEGVRTFIMTKTSRWFESRMTTTVVSASVRGVIFGLPPSSQSLQDLSTIRAVMSGSAVTAFTDLLMTPVLLLVAWLLHPLFGIIGLVAIATSFILMLINGYYSEKTTKIAQQINTNNILRTETAVRNSDVFVALGMLPAFIAQWVQRNAPAQQAYDSAAASHAILFGLTRFTRLLVQITIMTAGAFLVIDGDIAGGSLMASSMILYRAMGPAEQAISSWRQVSGARAAYKRLAGVLGVVRTETEAMPLPRPEGRLACENLTCLLPGRGLPVLESISFKLEPGDILGILGPSASGKSTLCRSIVGLLRPVRGFVRLDGADVSSWPSDDLGQYLGYLPQDVELFEGTVRANIARLDANAPSELVVDAARAAGAHELILRLPDGYDTEIGPAGSKLSGGQRQRIGLARAFYGRPPLIVLDEPNSSLDGEGIVALIKAIETAKGWGSTVILVSHQPHIMKPADKLLVLRNGRIQAFGSTAEVLRDLKMVGTNEEIPRAKPAPMVSVGEKLG